LMFQVILFLRFCIVETKFVFPSKISIKNSWTYSIMMNFFV
jgi:hypothetical protein